MEMELLYMGRPVSELTRDELVEALGHAMQMLEDERAFQRRAAGLLREIGQAQRGMFA